MYTSHLRSTIRDPKQLLVVAFLMVLLVIALVPFIVTILVSQKTNAEIYRNLWSLPTQFRIDYYTDAFHALFPYMWNSLLVCAVTVGGVIVLSSLSGYVFARLHFAGKNLLFMLLLALMMVPGILTLIPAFKWIQGIPLAGGNDILGRGGSGLLNTWWALWLPYWAGGQIFGILLFRTFCETIPESLFEAARIDGAGEFLIYTRIVLPLSLPIIATLAIIQFVGTYNDYVWPLVTISSPSNQVFAVGITQFAADAQLDMAPQMAGYIIGSIPLVIAFVFGMRYYVQGLTSGALKS